MGVGLVLIGTESAYLLEVLRILLVPLDSTHKETGPETRDLHIPHGIAIGKLGLTAVLYECAIPRVLVLESVPRKVSTFPYPSHICLVDLMSDDLPPIGTPRGMGLFR